jgi:hypothetical protein
MKMAKEQGLPLNPMKISGVCGRLMCCLGYENDQYHEMRGTLPRNGQWVTTASGLARVIGTSPLKQTVQVMLETDAIIELPVGETAPAAKPAEKPRLPVSPVSKDQEGEKPARRPDTRTSRPAKDQNTPKIAENQGTDTGTIIENQKTDSAK